jgi:serine/threonine-protein kinase
LVRFLAVVVIVLSLVVGYAAYHAHDAGMLPLGEQAATTEADATDPAPDDDAPPPGLPEIRADTREGFLAEFESGECTYVTRLALGPNAGTLAAFTSDAARFDGDGLAEAYQSRFGTRPALMLRQVEPEQCAALDFARALQGRLETPVQMYLDTDRLESGEAVTARIAPQGAQSIWAVLISPRGAVYNLTDRIEGATSTEASLRFGLTLNPGVDEAVQLVMVVTSDEPLVQAASARNGVAASALLPLVLDDITEAGGASATAALAFLVLTPPAPAESEEPEADDDAAVEDGG